MDPGNQADQKSGGASEGEVEQQQSLQFLALELPLPGQNAGCERWQHGASGGEDVEASRRLQSRFPGAARREIESDSGQKERNWKVDQDNVLRMFRQQGGLGIKGIHTAYSTTTLPVIFG